jgi:hypothetical protein
VGNLALALGKEIDDSMANTCISPMFIVAEINASGTLSRRQALHCRAVRCRFRRRKAWSAWNVITKQAIPGVRITPRRMQARHTPHAEVHIVAEAGHIPDWEQPEAFNKILPAFPAKQKRWPTVAP